MDENNLRVIFEYVGQDMKTTQKCNNEGWKQLVNLSRVLDSWIRQEKTKPENIN